MIDISCSFVAAAQKETKYIESITYTFSNTQLRNICYTQFGVSNNFYVFLIQNKTYVLQDNAEQWRQRCNLKKIHEYIGF